MFRLMGFLSLWTTLLLVVYASEDAVKNPLDGLTRNLVAGISRRSPQTCTNAVSCADCWPGSTECPGVDGLCYFPDSSTQNIDTCPGQGDTSTSVETSISLTTLPGSTWTTTSEITLPGSTWTTSSWTTISDTAPPATITGEITETSYQWYYTTIYWTYWYYFYMVYYSPSTYTTIEVTTTTQYMTISAWAVDEASASASFAISSQSLATQSSAESSLPSTPTPGATIYSSCASSTGTVGYSAGLTPTSTPTLCPSVVPGGPSIPPSTYTGGAPYNNLPWLVAAAPAVFGLGGLMAAL